MSPQDHTILAQAFESYLSAHQPYGLPDTLYEPIRYINELGGKRIRPALLLMAYNLWEEDITPALPAALAIEYFHNFSLMHDDIMDEAPLRRGKDTVHEKYGRNMAILSGDAMLIRSYELFLQAGERNGVGAQICREMCKAALEICEGQQMDMDFEKLPAPTEAEYIEMIRKKTSCLFGASLQIGAILGGASEQDAKALYMFGEKMGLSFQIQDDYLDAFGDENLTGKQLGGDILRGKKNFLYVHTYNILPPPDQKEFAQQYELAVREQNIEQVLLIYKKQNIDQYSRKMQADFFEEAVKSLETLAEDGRTSLYHFGHSIMERNF